MVEHRKSRTGKAHEEAAPKQQKKTEWWNRPVGAGIIGGVVSGLVILMINGLLAHSAKDLARDIATEITKQLDARSAKEADNLNNRITAEVGKQLAPIQQDIGKIKDNLHIAQTPRSGPSPFLQFAAMDQSQFIRVVPKVAIVATEAQRKGLIDTIQNIDAVQKKVATLPLNTPGLLPAAFALINYASFVREKNGLIPDIAAVRSKACPAFIKLDGAKNTIRAHVTGVSIDKCQQELDGLSLKDVTIRGAVII